MLGKKKYDIIKGSFIFNKIKFNTEYRYNCQIPYIYIGDNLFDPYVYFGDDKFYVSKVKYISNSQIMITLLNQLYSKTNKSIKPVKEILFNIE